MKRRWKAITAIVTIAVVLVAAVVLFATFQAGLSESARNEQNPVYEEAQGSVQVGLGESTTASNLTLRVTSVMNGTDPQARRVWATYETDEYAPLNPIQDSKYIIVNASVENAVNGPVPFRYADVILVGNDGRTYYANYAVVNASCTASLRAERLNPGGVCDIYVAFSIPNDVTPAKIVYATSNPAIVVNLT